MNINQELQFLALQKQMMETRHKKGFLERIIELLGGCVLGIVISVCLVLILYFGILLVENPVSLAIICITIFLIGKDILRNIHN